MNLLVVKYESKYYKNRNCNINAYDVFKYDDIFKYDDVFLLRFGVGLQKLEDYFDLKSYVLLLDFALVNLPFLLSPKNLICSVIHSESTETTASNLNFAGTQDHGLLNYRKQSPSNSHWCCYSFL